jgi:hypothetical protein
MNAMANRNDIDVFVSYDHADKERVRPLVDIMTAKGWSVWWDTAVESGAPGRDVLWDRLEHARAVCVVWTVSSVESSFVRDEASRANARGVLLPLRLDEVDQPLGFGEIQYLDMSSRADTNGGLEAAVAPLLRKIQALVDGATAIRAWETDIDADFSISRTRSGIDEARAFLARVRAMTDMLKANPGASASLGSALNGVRDTYRVVGSAIDEFLAPVTDGGQISAATFRSLADGHLLADIERERGHCKRIAQVYIESGGLRESLPESVGSDLRDEIDELILGLSSADDDLFNAMAAIGSTLDKQASVVVNLLLADQDAEANARLRHAEQVLRPLRQSVNHGMAEVERIASEFGIPSSA